MKKVKAFLAGLCLLLLPVLSAQAVTLKTMSTFAGPDAAAQTYVELLKSWEEKTGNTVEDDSAASDEAWKASVINDFAAGNEADILFYFAKTADATPILSKVVPIRDINAAYPDLNLPEDRQIAEDDGVVYAIPIRAWWEGLFVNKDLFEKYGLDLPTDWDKLVRAITVFHENGIVPIAVSFSDIPHYLIEHAILASGPPQMYMARPRPGETVPESWIKGTALLNTLYQLGAFPEDCNATTESITSMMFLQKRAAMQVDGSWFANGIPRENHDSTIVLPFPAYAEDAQTGAVVSGVSSGFYLTQRAWDDPDKRDAAVDLLRFLTAEENAASLGGFQFTGELARSANEMLENAVALSVIQDDMEPETRADLWFSKIPGIVDGTADPARMWEKIISADPFKSLYK